MAFHNRGFGRKRAGYTYEVELVAQYCAELPPGIVYAGFQLKRKNRLSVADAAPVVDGSAEWNTLCKQTCTLFKDSSGVGRWQPKEFQFKDLSGFDQLTIKAVYPQQQQGAGRPGPGSTGSAESSGTGILAAAACSPFRGRSLPDTHRHAKQQPWQLKAGRFSQQHERGDGGEFGGFGVLAGSKGSAGGLTMRRPAGATPLQLGDGRGLGESEDLERAAALTPTLILGSRGGAGSALPAQHQRGQVVTGLPEEQWSPVDLDKARAKLQSSDEEEEGDTISERWRLRPVRSLRRWLTAPEPDAAPTPTTEAKLISQETSVRELRRRCHQLLAERDEARAESYAAQSEALQRAVELDNLGRTKAMLTERLAATEAQLMAMCKDEASSSLVAALVEARVAAADSEYQTLQLQGEVRRYKAEAEAYQAQLVKLESQYRLSLQSLASRLPSKDPKQDHQHPHGARRQIGAWRGRRRTTDSGTWEAASGGSSRDSTPTAPRSRVLAGREPIPLGEGSDAGVPCKAPGRQAREWGHQGGMPAGAAGLASPAASSIGSSTGDRSD
ncbi:hypothetical protein N2152v2_000947 [Parachlorella kessleri]